MNILAKESLETVRAYQEDIYFLLTVYNERNEVYKLRGTHFNAIGRQKVSFPTNEKAPLVFRYRCVGTLLSMLTPPNGARGDIKSATVRFLDYLVARVLELDTCSSIVSQIHLRDYGFSVLFVCSFTNRSGYPFRCVQSHQGNVFSKLKTIVMAL